MTHDAQQVFSQVWSIVGQLQEEVNLFMAADSPASSQTTHAHGDAVEGDQRVKGMSTAGKDGGVVAEGGALASKMLVTPRINPFNAALYKNLARSLGIALKETPIMDRIEVEVREGGERDTNDKKYSSQLYSKICSCR